MLGLQECNALLPCSFGDGHTLGGPLKKVAARQHKGSTFLSQDAPPHSVFPVGCVECQFPNVVTITRGTPSRLRGVNSTDRAAKVGAMPGFLVESFVK